MVGKSKADILGIFLIILMTIIICLLSLIIFVYDDFIIYSNKNDIQHYNTEKQDWCIDRFKNNDNIRLIRFSGISMLPTLWDGNIGICDTSIKDYKEGMVVSFNNSGSCDVSHRIKAVYNDYVITQGDNNGASDGRIYFENISCVMVGVCY